jgi:hypothetical protein
MPLQVLSTLREKTFISKTMHAFKFCSYGQQRQHSSKKTTSSSRGLEFESSRLQSGKKLRKKLLSLFRATYSAHFPLLTLGILAANILLIISRLRVLVQPQWLTVGDNTLKHLCSHEKY